jgi:hypothetical protein
MKLHLETTLAVLGGDVISIEVLSREGDLIRFVMVGSNGAESSEGSVSLGGRSEDLAVAAKVSEWLGIKARAAEVATP